MVEKILKDLTELRYKLVDEFENDPLKAIQNRWRKLDMMNEKGYDAVS